MLSSESRQGAIALISELPAGFRKIGSAAPDQQADDNIIENRQQVGSMAHAQLGMILAHGGIAAAPSFPDGTPGPETGSHCSQPADC
jgi:hypothetical protein